MPDIRSRKKISIDLNVSEYLVWKAQKLKLGDSILATPRKKVGKSLKPEAKRAVMKMMNILNKCQARRIMSVFYLKPISKSASFYVISKSCINNLKLKIQVLGLDFLNLLAYAQNCVLLLEPQGHIR